jgi:hypothetical protein
MSKRAAQFERKERDFYPTPEAAVLPLLPHLPKDATFDEPCAGDGALVDSLQRAGLSCLYAADIHPMRDDIHTWDALNSPVVSALADYIITNPPWDRKTLHPMIEAFSNLRPTWLLFDADWMHTRQSARFMPLLRKIVSVGRVKWIPDSKMTGKDNCAWHLFDAKKAGPIEFVGRD